jgi:hypothetical protein
VPKSPDLVCNMPVAMLQPSQILAGPTNRVRCPRDSHGTIAYNNPSSLAMKSFICHRRHPYLPAAYPPSFHSSSIPPFHHSAGLSLHMPLGELLARAESGRQKDWDWSSWSWGPCWPMFSSSSKKVLPGKGQCIKVRGGHATKLPWKDTLIRPPIFSQSN